MFKDKRTRQEYFNTRRAERIDELRDFKKDKSCKMCGWNDHPEILQFHHRDPTIKEFSFSAGSIGNLSKKRIKEEMDKCDLLCPNCHNWLHYPK